MAATELASVDGRISPTTEATIPLPDDGLYRGDGVFEVIRLYGGRPFALGEHLDRLERSAAAIELPVERALIEREIEALLAELGTGDAQLRIVLTRGGRRILLIEPLPERGASVRLATVTYSPTVILTGVKSLSYAANMQATRIAQAPRRRRGGAGPPRRRRPRGAHLDDLLGLARGRPADARARRRASSSRSPARRSCARSTSRRASSRSTTCSARTRPSSPRPCARSSRSRRSTATSSSRGARTLEAQEALERALEEALGAPQSTA